MRLNLGGRTTRIEGFTNVDVFEGPTVDIKADIGDLKGIADGTVEEIYASHCLEHFPHIRTHDVLKNWHRVLKKGAKAYIAVPDFEAVVTIFQKTGMTRWIRNFLWGDQIYKEAYHYTGFTWASLASELVTAGFNDVKKINNLPYGLDDCSTLYIPELKINVSLNVEAVA